MHPRGARERRVRRPRVRPSLFSARPRGALPAGSGAVRPHAPPAQRGGRDTVRRVAAGAGGCLAVPFRSQTGRRTAPAVPGGALRGRRAARCGAGRRRGVLHRRGAPRAEHLPVLRRAAPPEAQPLAAAAGHLRLRAAARSAGGRPRGRGRVRARHLRRRHVAAVALSRPAGRASLRRAGARDALPRLHAPARRLSAFASTRLAANPPPRLARAPVPRQRRTAARLPRARGGGGAAGGECFGAVRAQ